jgi:hypothetical protein
MRLVHRNPNRPELKVAPIEPNLWAALRRRLAIMI